MASTRIESTSVQAGTFIYLFFNDPSNSSIQITKWDASSGSANPTTSTLSIAGRNVQITEGPISAVVQGGNKILFYYHVAGSGSSTHVLCEAFLRAADQLNPGTSWETGDLATVQFKCTANSWLSASIDGEGNPQVFFEDPDNTGTVSWAFVTMIEGTPKWAETQVAGAIVN